MLVKAGAQITKKAVRTKVGVTLFTSLCVGRAVTVPITKTDQDPGSIFTLHEGHPV